MDSGGECTNSVLQWYELINDCVSMCGCICVGCVSVCVCFVCVCVRVCACVCLVRYIAQRWPGLH